MSSPSYKSSISEAMARLSSDPATIFIGYGLETGRALGTIPKTAAVLETPVAENLMVGLATGLSLAGRKPVVFIERCDFLLNALDALVNHLVKIRTLSRGQFAPAAIIRIVIGNREKPLFTGPTHTQDFSDAVNVMLMDRANAFESWHLNEGTDIANVFAVAHANLSRGITTLIWEYKDKY